MFPWNFEEFIALHTPHSFWPFVIALL